MRVREIMSSGLITVGPDASLKDVASLLAEHAISGVPVVDGAGAVLGVVSKTDILIKQRALPDEQTGMLARLRGARGEGISTIEKVEARTAAEAMTAPAVTIDQEREVGAAAALMLDNRFNRLPVVHGGKLVGIVTRSDLVRAFTRSDEDIEREIREEIIEHSFWVPAGAIHVTVCEGVVQLVGEIETRADAEMLPEVVRKAVGVVAVESNLSWRVDGAHEFERRRA